MKAVRGKAKNKRSIDEKINLIMDAIKQDQRRVEIFFNRSEPFQSARYYTMAQIAKMAGYARSSRFMLTLYEMCDRGLLAKDEFNGAKTMKGKAICDVNIQFCLPQFSRQKLMKSMFTEKASE